MQTQSVIPQPVTRHSKVLRTSTIKDILPAHHTALKLDQPVQNPPAEETTCSFLLKIVKQWSSDLVLHEFKKIFVNPIDTGSSHFQHALEKVILLGDEAEFKNIFKRSCYILLNNWIPTRQYKPAQDLIQLVFNSPSGLHPTSPVTKLQKDWLTSFINSQDYEELKLFVAKYDQDQHWKSRYTSYLLAPQYANSENLIEQRQAAVKLSKQMKAQFRFDLAMYTAHAQPVAPDERKTHNPTALGDEALRLIKKVLAKRGPFSYANLANIFLKQVQNTRYDNFKQSLLNYLLFSANNQGLAETIKVKLGKELEFLYQDSHEERLDKTLLLKTCNRIIECLTVERTGKPALLFISLASQGKPLTLAVLLLKVMIICPPTRIHLEVCMAKMIQYYEGYSQQECQWVINFLEVSKITLAIYTENIQYNLVNMEDDSLAGQSVERENACRVFSRTCQ